MDRRHQNQLRTALDQCLERMAQGATVEQCLALHQDLAQDLRPLLETALDLRTALSADPSQSARAAGRMRLQEAMARAPSARPAPLFMRGPWRAVAVACSLVLVVFLGGFTVVRASGDTTPGDTLYPVKRSVERIRLNWPFQSSESKADYSAHLAALRLQELTIVARHRKVDQLGPLSDHVQRDLQRAAELTVSQAQEVLAQPAPDTPSGAPPQGLNPYWQRLDSRRQRLQDVRRRLDADYQAGIQQLRAIAAQAPEEYRPALQDVTRRCTQHYQGALQRLDGLLNAPWPPDGRRFPPRQGLEGPPRPFEAQPIPQAEPSQPLR